jgi:hypothetical protein
MLAAAGGLAVNPGTNAPLRARPAQRFDWIGFVLLATFMIALVSALHALPAVASAPLGFVALGALSVAALVALLTVERHIRDPLIDLGLFGEAVFVRAVAVGSLAMACILGLLLFYNLDAQSPAGLSLTPVEAGLSLLPMSCGLLIFAFAAPSLVRRFGPRRALGGSNLLIVAASALIAVSIGLVMWVPLVIGLFAVGMGLALPYATAPRLALSTLPTTRAGAGSGIINACTFLGGSIGVAGGAVANALAGLPAALGLIALFALVGVGLCRGLAAGS